jgi:nucleoside phosphorylase
VSRILLFTALRAEQAALPAAVKRDAHVIRSGMGRRRARIAAARGLAVEGVHGVAIAGVCAAAAAGLRTGDVLLGTELRRPDGTPLAVPGSAMLTVALRRRGLQPRVGTLQSVERIAGPAERRFLAEQGVDGVDMESAWLADAVPQCRLKVVS